MTLTVTPGAADADSYASLAALDAYHDARGNTAWAAATDADKETAARRATQWLDGTYRDRWPGLRVDGRSQALDWPRSGVTDRDGWSVDHEAIPTEIVQATAEAALRELASANSLSPDVTPGKAKVLTGAGPVSWTPLRSSASAEDMTPTLIVVDRILSALLSGRHTVELIRG